MAPGLRDSVVPGGAEPPPVEVGGVPPDVGVAGGQLVHAQRPGVAGADHRVVVQSDFCPSDRTCPGPECRHMFSEPRRASALVHQGWYNTVRVMYCIVPIQYCNLMYCISNLSGKVLFPHRSYVPLLCSYSLLVYTLQLLAINMTCLS